MRHRRGQIVAILLSATLVLALAARLTRPGDAYVRVSEAAMVRGAAGEVELADSAGCGVTRWAVKTMVDPRAGQVRLAATRTTVAALGRRARPAGIRSSRVGPVELHVYRVVARLTAFKLESDSDVHLTIADPMTGATMIAEFPRLSCVHGGSPEVRKRMADARAALIRACGRPSPAALTPLSGTATLTGVGFFDAVQGQSGMAPNAVELHPVLSFSGSCR